MKLFRSFYFCLFLITLSSSITVSAQSRLFSVSGKIIDAEEFIPLELVNITFNDNVYWAVSDLKGKFTLKLPNGSYKYSVSYIGYENATGTLVVNGKDIDNLTIKLNASSLSLSEVTVTAKETTLGSSSIIDQTAIQHLQPKSVEDLLQLTPGSLTQNPSLDNAGQAYIREISGSNSNSLGTAIVVDGTPISNDASLQLLSTAKSGLKQNMLSATSQSTAGKGIDLRSISPDNIENIEVIRGIPSVEYGNLTSGAVIIKTKQGATPLEIKGKVDPNSKMAYMGKGFRLPTGSVVNLSVDYSSSYSDIRFLYEGFERVTADAGVSHTFFYEHPLSVTVKASYFQNINNVRKDPQQKVNEASKNKYSGVRLSLSGDWNIKTLLASNLSYNVSANLSHQEDYEKTLWQLTTGMTPVASATQSGEFLAQYLNASYYGEHTIDGKPIDIFAQLKGSKSILVNEDFSFYFKEGLEWKYDDNRGNGLQFDPLYPPFVRSVQTVRPRSYKDIPAMETVAGFLENKTIMPLGRTRMTLQAGIRATNLFIDHNYLKADNMKTFEPRINLEWQFLKQYLDHFSISAGWGMTSKMPTLAYLYPDKAYFDDATYKYVDPNMDINKSLAVMTTSVIEDTSNPDIKPSEGKKMEFSLNFLQNSMNGTVTFFIEKYDNEFSFRNKSYTFPFRSLSVPSGSSNMRYENGNLYYDTDDREGLIASAIQDSTFQIYNIPSNGVSTEKTGIEYSFNFGQIPLLSTSVIMDGAWLRIKRTSNTDYWSTMSTYLGEYYPFHVLYAGGEGSISTRVNTNIRLVTHLPKIRMVFSTTAQIVWGETSRNFYQNDCGKDLFFKDIDVQAGAGKEALFVYPVGFRDYAGNYHDWNREFGNLTLSEIYNQYPIEYRMIMQESNVKAYDKEKYPGYIIFNFRLTKEFGNNMSISFMANNLFNTRKIYKNETSKGYSKLTIPMYFGAEMTLKI